VRCSRWDYKLAVVPANAGTHNHRLEFTALERNGFLSNNRYHAVWVPAFAGTTDEIAFPAKRIPVRVK